MNARVKMEPEDLETLVRDALTAIAESFAVRLDIVDLQCFSPAYPNPPYRKEKGVGS